MKMCYQLLMSVMKSVGLKVGDVCGTCGGGRWEMHIGFWWWKLKEGDLSKYLAADGM